MKFNFRGQIEVKPYGDRAVIVTSAKKYYSFFQVITLDDLKAHFTPADCEALNLVDPDRTERLSPPAIGGVTKCKPKDATDEP